MDLINYTIDDLVLINLPKIQSRSGNITPVQNSIEIPFDIKRIYYLYDIPGGESRGAHGHKQLEQIVIAASGSFDITISDGIKEKTFSLNRPYIGLNIKPGLWRDLSNFSSGAICLVMASESYNEADYIRDYDEFINFKLKK
jgi:hypothetical protein